MILMSAPPLKPGGLDFDQVREVSRLYATRKVIPALSFWAFLWAVTAA